MQAFKCDRCGRYYDGCGNGKGRSKFLSLSIPELELRNSCHYFDLCDACFDEAKKWLGVKDEEENNGSISN